jgi:hypothetical protein
MSTVGKSHPTEYSDRFDELRQNRVAVSLHKYGSAKDNFGEGLVDALATHDLCVRKYVETGNTEYLVDAANYLMFEFMYPQRKGAFFKATDGDQSAGVVGTPVNDIHVDKHFQSVIERFYGGESK